MHWVIGGKFQYHQQIAAMELRPGCRIRRRTATSASIPAWHLHLCDFQISAMCEWHDGRISNVISLYPPKKGPVTPRDPKLYQGFYVKGVFIVRGKGYEGIASKNEQNFHLETTAFWGVVFFTCSFTFFYICLLSFTCFRMFYGLFKLPPFTLLAFACHLPSLQQYVWASCLGHISAVLPPLLGPDRSQPQSHLTND